MIKIIKVLTDIEKKNFVIQFCMIINLHNILPLIMNTNTNQL